jgi:hypothetical protein
VILWSGRRGIVGSAFFRAYLMAGKGRPIHDLAGWYPPGIDDPVYSNRIFVSTEVFGELRTNCKSEYRVYFTLASPSLSTAWVSNSESDRTGQPASIRVSLGADRGGRRKSRLKRL